MQYMQNTAISEIERQLIKLHSENKTERTGAYDAIEGIIKRNPSLAEYMTNRCFGLLKNWDHKVRRNAALLLGDVIPYIKNNKPLTRRIVDLEFIAYTSDKEPDVLQNLTYALIRLGSNVELADYVVAKSSKYIMTAPKSEKARRLGLLLNGMGLQSRAKPGTLDSVTARQLDSMRQSLSSLAAADSENVYKIVQRLTDFCKENLQLYYTVEGRKFLSDYVNVLTGLYRQGTRNDNLRKRIEEVIVELVRNDRPLENMVLEKLLPSLEPVTRNRIRISNILDIERLVFLYNKHGKDAINALADPGYFNISVFGRYSSGVLESAYSAYENMLKGKRPEKQIAYAVTPYHDHNGAFYANGDLPDLLRNYTVIPVEAATETQLLKLFGRLEKGLGKPSLVVLGGHGSPTTIELSGGNEIHVTDKEFIKGFVKHMAPHGQLVLDSCSTGAPMKRGSNIEDAFYWAAYRQITVYAPPISVGVRGYEFDKSGVMGVVYGDNAPAVALRDIHNSLKGIQLRGNKKSRA